MTITPDGAGYQNLAGAPVTTTVHLVGQYACAGCDTTTVAITKQLTGDHSYDPSYAEACTNWTALAHAKTCTTPIDH
ncbi:hypothetical protein [Kitasatospora sp. NBC_01302]|uniref:hypothetical protein n=1 Tax=Kitasatospora sp. NBC_01302 TaxID=2903575 RepID=UPI002E0E999D|nr:hypothetical protein OG294_14240 [Kitasatospora sp. NBC_01302]